MHSNLSSFDSGLLKKHTFSKKILIAAALLLGCIGISHPSYAVTEDFKLLASDAASQDLFGRSVAIDGDTVVVGATEDDSTGSAYVYDCSSLPCIELNKLIASDAGPNDEFGISVSISGSLVLIGAHEDDDGADNSGSAYYFDLTTCGSVCNETGKLTASNAALNDRFGWSVSLHGTTAVIGAIEIDGPGSAYYFDLTSCGSACSETGKLTASDAATFDRYGWSVSVHETTAVVGSIFNNSRAAYYFDLSSCGAACTETGKLTASDGSSSDDFGSSVSVYGNTVLIGSRHNDQAGLNAGSAYYYDLSTCGTACTEAGKLTASDAEIQDRLGNSVSVYETTAVVGAAQDDDSPGKAYYFDLSACISACSETEKLTSSDGDANDEFGNSVAIYGNKIVIGAAVNDDAGGNSGSAYMFELPHATSIREKAKLVASDADIRDQFGYSVSIDGTTVVVGAPDDNDRMGSAYLFDCSNYPCVEVSKLVASSPDAKDLFGHTVSVSSGIAVIGAYGDGDGGNFAGAAYYFDLSSCGSVCTETGKLTASDAAPVDYFGESVSVSGTKAVIGARLDDDAGSESGSAYYFDLSNCGAACTEVSKLTASDAAREEGFGNAVSISGTTAVIGSVYDDTAVGFSGSAYYFDLLSCAATCTETGKLTASDAAYGDLFGHSVSVSDTTALIGAYLKDGVGTDSGSAYYFDLSTCGTACTETGKLMASDAGEDAQFGWSTSIDGITAIISANGDNNHAGTAYEFDLSNCGAACTETGKFTASDAAQADQFGFSASLSNNIAVIGAPKNNDQGLNSGSAYVFDLQNIADPSAECGQPLYNQNNDKGLFIWKDCGGTEKWFVRGTGGGDPDLQTYMASISSDSGFSNVTPFSYESNDVLNNQGNRIDITLFMRGTGQDGIEFNVIADMPICFDASQLPTGAQIKLGSQQLPMAGAFDLNTQAACLPPPPVVNEPECGQPLYNQITDKGLYIWKDCGGTEKWFVRGTGGGNPDLITYMASISSDSGFSNVASFSYESTDVLSNLGNQINVTMNMRNTGQDGIEFTVAPTATTCLHTSLLPSGAQVILGAGKMIMTGAFDLHNQSACLLPPPPVVEPECGRPLFNQAVDKGLYVWKDCGSTEKWFVRGTGGGDPDLQTYMASISSDSGFSNVASFSYESTDLLNNLGNQINVTMNMRTTGQDGIEFAVSPTATTCFDTSQLPVGAQVILGSEKMVMTGAFDLHNQSACLLPPPPVSEPECGRPLFNQAVDKGLYVWKDCGNTEKWFVRGTGGGDPDLQTYMASISSDSGFSNVASFSYESTDVLNNLGNQINVTMNMRTTGQDGIEFAVSPTATTCFDTRQLPIGAQVILGSEKMVMTGAFDLHNQSACLLPPPPVSEPECGRPLYNQGVDKGLYVWKDCGSTEKWFVRGTGGGDPDLQTYMTSISSDSGFSNVSTFSYESNDVLNNPGNRIDTTFYMRGTGQDGIEFDFTPGAATCFNANLLPAGTQVILGSQQMVIAGSFDLETQGACMTTVSCPCNFNTVTLGLSSWTATPIKDNLNQTCLLTNAQNPRTEIRIDGPNAGRICRVRVDGIFQFDDTGLTNEELNACASDLDTFTDNLNAQASISVTNANTTCQSY